MGFGGRGRAVDGERRGYVLVVVESSVARSAPNGLSQARGASRHEPAVQSPPTLTSPTAIVRLCHPGTAVERGVTRVQ